jgi:2-polyprenyl-6-methoxyphenol hydroxylase-like FAD-dependent oxidoreductase
MRIAILGGGPAGLYFASLWKRRHRADDVELFEQNPIGATFGFGVVFSDRALEFLRDDDPETFDLITPRMETWRDITLVHRGERIAIDGVGFSAIGRLEFLRLLHRRVDGTGVKLVLDRGIRSVGELDGFDLIIAADGVNSLVRRSFADDFGTSLSRLSSKFAWWGTTKRFETLTQTFIETELGSFNAHHYRYSPTMSTFIIECDHATWLRAGFDHLAEQESRTVCERIFADALDGHSLISNRSVWQNFLWIWNERWSHRNMVLVGDALHTAHFSIGSGTRLALEDVLALVEALEAEPGDLPAAFVRYERSRRPIVEKLVAAAKASAAWYEDFPTHMRLAPLDFAYGYITRSGRIDLGRLRALSPRFMTRYEDGRRHEGRPTRPAPRPSLS